MAELVDRRASDPAVRRAALAIVGQAPARNVSLQLALLRSWLARHVHFVADPLHDELLTDPVLMLREIAATGKAYGDCDDAAVLAATLATAIGIAARFQVVSFDSGPMAHVWTELAHNGQWVGLDVTRPRGAMLPIRRRWTVPLYLEGGARVGVGDPITVGGYTIDLDAPLWLGLDTKTWLIAGAAGLVLLVMMRR